MATYDLSRANLLSLLGSTVSPQTEVAIIAALKAAGDYPSASQGGGHGDNDGGDHGKGHGPGDNDGGDRGKGQGHRGDDDRGGNGGPHQSGGLATYVDDSSGSVNVNLPGDIKFFLEESANANVTLNYHGPVVAATGDGNVTLLDKAYGDDTLVGGAGKDKITVEHGNNLLIGGTGANTLVGGTGNDTLIGGGHSSLVAGSGNDSLLGGSTSASADTLAGGAGFDTLKTYHGDDVFKAGSGTSLIFAGDGNNTLYGGSGHDTVHLASGGTNVFYGGSGHDTIDAAKVGDDTIYGGAHTTLDVAHGFSDALVTKLGGGVTQLTFGNGQTIDVKNTTVVFEDHHTVKY